MKREILFRGKRVDNGEWAYGRGLLQCKDELGNEIVAIFTDIVKSEKYIKKEGRYTLYYEPVKAETLGQYTGLKDKNGKKIFEGDIVTGRNCRFVVKYDDRQAEFVAVNSTLPNGFGLPMSQTWINETNKIICGNIHDNLELIKKSV